MVEISFVASEADWENNSQSSYEEFYKFSNVPEIRTDSLVTCISDFLSNLAAENQTVKIDKTPFDSHKIPAISLRDYLKRILTYSIVSKECYAIALIYIDRYTSSHPNCCVTP